jgi:hypothetical protein
MRGRGGEIDVLQIFFLAQGGNDRRNDFDFS